MLNMETGNSNKNMARETIAKVLRLGQITEYLINIILKLSIIYLQSMLYSMQLQNSMNSTSTEKKKRKMQNHSLGWSYMMIKVTFAQ